MDFVGLIQGCTCVLQARNSQTGILQSGHKKPFCHQPFFSYNISLKLVLSLKKTPQS